MRPCWIELCLLCLALAAPATARAQDLAWRIPARGAVDYERAGTALVLSPLRAADDSGVHRVIRPFEQRWRAWPGHVDDGAADPPDDWFAAAWDDAAWPLAAPGGFALDPSRDARTPNEWTSDQLCVRTRFELPTRKCRAIVLSYSHDDDLVVWLNGRELHRAAGARTNQRVVLGGDALALLQKGNNVLAAECRNIGGDAIFELGLTLLERADPADAEACLRADAPSPQRALALRGEMFLEWRAPASLFAGELDAAAQFVTMRPVDLRELGWWLGTDLRGGGGSRTIKDVLPRMAWFGDVQVRGKREALAADGSQSIAVEFHSIANAPHGDNKAYVRAHVDPHTPYEIAGRCEILRHVDATGGAVTRFDVSLRAVLTTSQAEQFELRFEESWHDARVRANRDAQFDTDLVQGIESAARYLRDSIRDLDAAAVNGDVAGQRSYGSGTLALVLLAMLKGGIARDDEVLRRGFEALRGRELVDTYSLGCAMLAFEALYSPIGEREDLIAGKIDRPYPRRPSAEDRARLERYLAMLLENTDTRVDRDQRLRFNYVKDGRFDTSVNQYGLLGLYAAQLCEVPIDTSHWRAAIRHLVESMEKPRGEHALLLEGHADIAQTAPSRRTVTSVPVAGFGYHMGHDGRGQREPIYGSMVCAGITGLALCRSGLQLAGVDRSAEMRTAEEAMRSAFAWLAQNFTVRFNPGEVHQLLQHHYYYLYGMERACELSDVVHIDGRDWYFEAASALLAMQRPDGSWPSDKHGDDVRRVTSMALLVLRKESLPVLSRR